VASLLQTRKSTNADGPVRRSHGETGHPSLVRLETVTRCVVGTVETRVLGSNILKSFANPFLATHTSRFAHVQLRFEWTPVQNSNYMESKRECLSFLEFRPAERPPAYLLLGLLAASTLR
jgi:hypothetical protein